jgi:hypothetical protein
MAPQRIGIARNAIQNGAPDAARPPCRRFYRFYQKAIPSGKPVGLPATGRRAVVPYSLPITASTCSSGAEEVRNRPE